MLIEQTIERMRAMRMGGMADSLRRWTEQGDRPPVDPPDLVGLLVDAEWIDRENRKLTARLQKARFREAACVEDIDYRPARGLTKSAVLELAGGRWIQERRNLIITGLTGVGKTYLACAIGNRACRDGFNVAYTRASRLYDDLYRAKADGSYPRFARRLVKADLLILDDFGLEPLDAHARRSLLDIVEDRHRAASTLVTSQLEPKNWHVVIGDETIADAICDRIVHGAMRLKVAGESMRKVLSARRPKDDDGKSKSDA